MIKFALLLISCVSMFAQRTPLKVNGAVINNPNLTNSATVTYSVNGANISATAAGGGGDTIWTNDNGTISATSTVADGGTAFSMGSSNVLSTGNLLKIQNDSDESFVFRSRGELLINGRDYSQIAGNSPGGTNFFDIYAADDDIYLTFWIEEFGRQALILQPTAPDGSPIAVFDSKDEHTSGNLMEVKNNTVNKAWTTFDGVSTAVQGFSSTATDAAVTIASTGWTNTFGKNAVVYMDGVGLTFTVYNNALTPVYTNSVSLVGASVLLQPSGKVIITDGTLGVGRATPF